MTRFGVFGTRFHHSLIASALSLTLSLVGCTGGSDRHSADGPTSDSATSDGGALDGGALDGAADSQADGASPDGSTPDGGPPVVRDQDGDGFDADSFGGRDCDDTRAEVNPAAVEVCEDGIDQDCDGEDIGCDEVDGDGDGYTPASGDCDDARADVNPSREELPYNGLDDDCNPRSRDDDLDDDGHDRLTDCDDERADVHPGAVDRPYDGVDQDCRGGDQDDVDGDGYAATIAGGLDCDDMDTTRHPAAVDVCGDGIDQNCDGSDSSCTTVDRDGDGYSAAAGDCDDDDASTHPGATEVPYDGRDNDCNTSTPDDDLDGDGYRRLAGDCDDSDPAIRPNADEIAYDGIDQDCSGSDLVDVDRDGYTSTMVAGGDDCDDTRAFVHPGATERPYDGLDDDCDGTDTVDRDTYLDVRNRFDYSRGHDLVGGPEGYFAAYTSDGAVIARGLDTSGSPIGSRTILSPTTDRIALARARTDRYLVVWNDTLMAGGVSNARIRGAWLDQRGTILSGGAFTIHEEPTSANALVPFTAAGNGSGNVIVLFGPRTIAPAVSYATGSVGSNAFTTVNGGHCGDSYSSTDVSPAASGFLVACAEYGMGTWAHYLTTAGAPSALHPVATVDGIARVVWNGTENVVCTSDGTSGSYGVWVRRMSSLPPTEPIQEVAPTSSGAFAAQITKVGSRLLVVYQDAAIRPTILSARWLRANGTPDGDAFILNAPGATNWSGPIRLASTGSSALALGVTAEGWVTIQAP